MAFVILLIAAIVLIVIFSNSSGNKNNNSANNISQPSIEGLEHLRIFNEQRKQKEQNRLNEQKKQEDLKKQQDQRRLTEQLEEQKRQSEQKLQAEAGFIISHDNPTPYKWYSLWHYYPKNRYPGSSIPVEDIKNRNAVYDFKDGRTPDLIAKKIAFALIQKFGKTPLEGFTLLIIPASTNEKTRVRFETFCSKLCLYTGMKNGYSILTNTVNREPAHLGGVRGNNSFNLTTQITGKKLLVFDDVRTSGRSSDNVYNFLKSNGAAEILFVYLSRTI